MVVGSCNHLKAGMSSGAVAPFRLSSYPLFFGLAVSAFEGIGLVLPVEASMAQPERFPSVLRNLMIGFTTLYVIIGALGYMAFGDDTHSIIFMNLPHSDLTLVTQVLYCVGLFFTYPVILFPATQIMESYSWYERLPGQNHAVVKRCLFRSLVVVVCTVVAIVTPNFGIFMDIIGSVACNALSFILPSLFYLNIFKSELSRTQRCKTWGIVVFGCVAGVLCFALSIKELVAPAK